MTLEQEIASEMSKIECECVCPDCGVIYKRMVEKEHAESPYAWRRAGYLVIICNECG